MGVDTKVNLWCGIGMILVAAMPTHLDFALGGASTRPQQLQKSLVKLADHILEKKAISYVYGGNQLGKQSECKQCASCLDQHNPKPKQRLASCPLCRGCALDCSHFIHHVFGEVGMPYPYLTTKQMRRLTPEILWQKFNMRVIDLVRPLAVGDLLVYNGHVVLVEKLHTQDYVDIIHSTSGREIRGGGMAIQRARHVLWRHFRGPVERVLRHRRLAFKQVGGSLRKVEKRRPRPQ